VKSEITLTSKEVLFISAILDATEFIGVPDAFFGIDDAEIQQEFLNIQTALDEKGYAEMDFDGSFTLNENVRELVDICANCDTFVLVDKNKSETSQLRELYYAKSGQIVRIKEDAKSNVITPISNVDSLIENIIQGVELHDSGAPKLKYISIASEILSDVKEKADSFEQSESLKILIDNGCDELSAKAILNGLMEKGQYYAVTITVFEGEREGVYSTMLTCSENGIYRLTPSIDEEQDVVQFDALSATQAKTALVDIVHQVFPVESEDFI
jgi:hypothetical protein